MYAGLRWAIQVGLLAVAAVAGSAEPTIRQVLMLQSFARGNLIIDTLTADFRVDLQERVREPVNYVQVVVGPTGFVSAPEQSIVDFVGSTFANRARPDLVVTVGGPASEFARKHRQQLFPEAPLLFAAVDELYLGDVPLDENEIAVAVDNDFPAMVDNILRILPNTRQVFMIVGNGAIRDFWRQRLEAQFSRFRGRVNFIWSDELSFPEIIRRTSALPPDSAIYFITMGTDASGAAYADERVLADLRALANAPIFSAHSVYLGSGIVGGSLLSVKELSLRTSAVAHQLLSGASPDSARVPPLPPGQPVFDWRELKRWNIPESRLPPGSLVKFRGPTLWSEYQGPVLATLGALMIQALLILGLLYERRARHRAENESRTNLTLAADVSRRETMSALSSSISHELGQPLGAMIRNTEALQMLISSKGSAPASIDEILSDIHADGVRAGEIMARHRLMLRSRQLQQNPVDVHAFLKGALALVAHDLRARQVQVSVNVPTMSCIVSGDAVLLQQVFVNLLMNSLDAMADTSPDRRHITIGMEPRRGNVEVSVHDTGSGLPEDLINRLFTPFVTTKSHGIGIGLAIVRTIVDAHGGSISARNHPEGGAIFTITLRASHSPESTGEHVIAGSVGEPPRG